MWVVEDFCSSMFNRCYLDDLVQGAIFIVCGRMLLQPLKDENSPSYHSLWKMGLGSVKLTFVFGWESYSRIFTDYLTHETCALYQKQVVLMLTAF